MLESVLEETYRLPNSVSAGAKNAELSRSLTFLSHQMIVIMKSLNIAFCNCGPCTEHLASERITISNYSTGLGTGEMTNDHCNTSAESQSVNPEIPMDGDGTMEALSSDPSCSQMAMEDDAAYPALDRRHKYYTSRKQRYEIAKCGRIYGTQVAAKKYNIPPYAVRYYVNTMARSLKLSKLKVRPKRLFHPGFPKLVDKGEKRGRPCLLGKDLDVALLNHLIQIKTNLFGGNLNASQGLRVARDFLLAKAPSVLAECGGNIKLSYSWGTSLLKRMAEREKELMLENQVDNSMLGEAGVSSNIDDVVNAEGVRDETDMMKMTSTDVNASCLSNGVVPGSSFTKRYSRKGRPLLLGEELDKKLLDYLIQLEKTTPGEISSVSRALHHAQTFLRTNAPGLLIEDGGSLKLSYSWAISMLRRVVDRSKGHQDSGEKASPSEGLADDPEKGLHFLNQERINITNGVFQEGDLQDVNLVKEEFSEFT